LTRKQRGKSVVKKFCLGTAIAVTLFFCNVAHAALEPHNVAKGTEPCIASEGDGKLHASMLWHEDRSAIHDVFYVRSEDSGSSWTSPTNVSKTPGSCSHPEMAVDKSGSINIVWSDTRAGVKGHDIFFARSQDNGKTWTEPQDISKTDGVATSPVVAVGPDQSIHVAWRDTASGDTRPDIFYASSTDQGKTWTKAKDISNTPKWSSDPTIAVSDDGIVHVSWLDSRSGEQRPDIFYIRKSEGAWTNALNVSNSERLSAHPSIASGPKGMVYIVWSDNSRKEQSPDIWCAVSDRKEHFGQPINISDTPGVSSQPTIAGDSRGRVVVAWSDTSPGAPHIYARVSNDRADDFTTVLDLPHTLQASKHPRVAIDGEKAFVIWEELNGNDSTLLMSALPLKGIATGPAHLVDPKIRSHNASGNH